MKNESYPGQIMSKESPTEPISGSDYRNLLFNTPVGMLSVNKNGRILFVNQTLIDILGSPSEEATRAINLFEFPPLKSAGVPELIRECIDRGKDVIAEIPYRSKWGKDVIFNIHIKPVKDEHGSIKNCFAVVQDISKKKQAEKNLQDQLNIERIVARISTDLIGLADDELDNGINKALGVVGTEFGARRAHVFQIIDDMFIRTHKWVETEPDDYPAEAERIAAKHFQWFASRLQSKQILFFEDLSMIPETAVNERNFVRDIKMEPTVFVSMRKRNELIGFVAFTSVKKDKWNPEYLQMLGFIGELLVNALERLRTSSELRKSEEKYRRIFNQLHDIYCETHPDGTITTISPSLKNHLGYEPEEVIGRSIGIFYNDPDERDDFRSRVFREGSVDHFDVIAKRKDGSLMNASINAHAVYDDHGKPVMCVGTFHDVTEMKRAERTLLESKMVAEEANRTKSEFLASMSHELRTPLNSIIGFSDFLLQADVGSLNKRQEKYIGNISSSGKHLLNLINGVLDISKIESGEMYLKPETFSFPLIINDVVNVSIPLALKKGITIVNNVSSETTLNADRIKVKQILYNLLSNAIKFTPENGYVTLSTKCSAGMLNVCVEDTGIGIMEKDMEKIFQPFKQIDSFYTREYDGTGLGLALVKQLVEMHGGDIEVESEINKGSKFIFSLPLEQP